MNKLKTFVTKHDNLFLFLLFLVISTGFIFKNQILGYDSLWVFGNLFKLGHGFKIYEEVNIVTFPLFYELFRMLLSLFNNYLGFLLLNYLIVTPLYFMVYQVFKACNLKKNFALLFTLIIWVVTTQTTIVGPSYNTFPLLLYLVGLLLYLKKKDSKFSFIIQGLFAFLILMCNQKFGVAYIGGLLLLHLFNIKSENKSIVNLIKTYLVTVLLCALFVLVLFLTNKLNSFIDLTISGLGSFAHNYNINAMSIVYILGLFAFFVFSFICINRKYNNYETIKPLLSFSISLLVITYPILNLYHFLLYFTVFFILVLFVLYNLFEQLLTHKTINKVINIMCTLAATILVVFSVIIFINWNSKKISTPDSIFYGAVLDKDLQEPVKETTKYIESLKEQNKNYRILSIHAMFYTLDDVPEKNNSYFDMPLKGNLGKTDWHVLSDMLDQEPEGTYIIIDRKIEDQFLIYQFPEEIYNYVNDHYKYVQDIGFYAVYEK